MPKFGEGYRRWEKYQDKVIEESKKELRENYELALRNKTEDYKVTDLRESSMARLNGARNKAKDEIKASWDNWK